jgi:nucleotide-binding universal stress UspA family protein
MKTIIVPVDFSPASDNALNYAIGLAAKTQSSVLLFHAFQIPVSMTDTPIVLVSVEEMQKNAGERINELKIRTEQKNPGVKIFAEAKLGNTVDELETFCNNIKPFAVVMGTKGESAVERVLFGSTTLTAIKHLSWRVIVVPPGKAYDDIKKIGFACDMKEVVDTTPAKQISDFVKEIDGELHVLNIETDKKNGAEENSRQLALLQTMLADVTPVYHFLKEEDIETGINRFADENSLDLVIAIPKKHKLLDGLFRKSHTRKLVFESHVPVMCVHE